MKRFTNLITARTLLIVVLGFLIVFPLGCSKKKPEAKEIRIGAISPFTGEGANYGKAARTAIDLAVDEINKKGGINGRKLVVQYEDDKGNPKDALSAFNKLATVDKVPAILGPFYSTNVLACAPVANRSKTVLLTGTATSDNIRDAGEYVFRVCPSNDEQAKTIAKFVFENLGLRKSFIIYRNVDYGITLRDKFEKAFKALGGTILGAEAVTPDTSDLRAQLTKAKAVSAELIYAAVHYPEGGALLRQAKELGVSSVIVGTDGGYDPKLLEIAGEAAEGSYWVTIGWGDESSNPNIARFRKAYKEHYEEEPGVYSGLFYDAAHVLAKALAEAKAIDGPSLQEALSNIVYEGPTGITKFDEFGDVEKPFAVYIVKSGQFVPVDF